MQRQMPHQEGSGSVPIPVSLQISAWNEGSSIADSCAIYYGRFMLLELIDALAPPPALRRLLLLLVNLLE